MSTTIATKRIGDRTWISLSDLELYLLREREALKDHPLDIPEVSGNEAIGVFMEYLTANLRKLE